MKIQQAMVTLILWVIMYTLTCNSEIPRLDEHEKDTFRLYHKLYGTLLGTESREIVKIYH